MSMNKPVVVKTKVIRIKKVRDKMSGIIIVQWINIKTLFRMGRDCQMMVICRRLSEITRDTSVKIPCSLEYTTCH